MNTNLSTLRTWSIIGLLLVTGIVISHLWLRSRTYRAREEIVVLSGQLTIGIGRQEVQRVFTSGRYRSLHLHDIGSDLMLVYTPIEWGAKNWILRLEFKRDKLAATKVRLHDNAGVKPSEAPEDRISEDR